MKSKIREGFVFAARLLIGGILIYAGFLKAVGPAAEFAAALDAYKLFPSAAVGPLSLLVPYLEMWIGLFLVFGFYTRWGALAASLLFIGFMVTIGSALLRGIDLASCGCFGPDAIPPRYTLLMDTVLLGLSVAITRLTRLPSIWSLDKILS